MKAQSNRTSNKVGHRRSNSRHNGSTSGLGGRASPVAINPKSSSQDGAIGQPPNSTDELGDNRLVFLIAKSIGKPCVITTTDGSRYKGLLLTVDWETPKAKSPSSVVIKLPQLVGKSLINEKNNSTSCRSILLFKART